MILYCDKCEQAVQSINNDGLCLDCANLCEVCKMTLPEHAMYSRCDSCDNAVRERAVRRVRLINQQNSGDEVRYGPVGVTETAYSATGAGVETNAIESAGKAKQ